MDKLRKEFIKERQMMAEAMKSVVIERRAPIRPPVPPRAPPLKMGIDPHKLEETIKKACIPVVRKGIKILDKLPDRNDEVAKPSVTIAVCKAKNLNGTPCKCRAKIGNFCAKHAP